MSESPRDTVEVPRALLGVLVMTLVLALMGLAFLAGRESKSPPAPLVVTSSPPPAPVVAVARPEAPPAEPLAVAPEVPPPPAASAPPPAPIAVSRTPAPVARARTAPAAPPAPVRSAAPRPVANPAERARVLAYLDKVEAVTAGSQSLGDPNEFATNLLNQAMLGDTSGIDQLIAQGRQSKQQLAQIQPPPSCQEHHRLSTQVLQGGLDMLLGLKNAMQTSDTTALTAIAGRGQQMQAQVQRLQALTQELRTRP